MRTCAMPRDRAFPAAAHAIAVGAFRQWPSLRGQQNENLFPEYSE